ncbi:ATP-binding protein [bacterium SCSIO 12741]|nr:ATP-binding protein [bacterium SCSIO 12741]
MMAPLRLLISGPESTGKSTLAQELSDHFQAPVVWEQARPYLEKYGPDYDFEDLKRIGDLQFAAENEAFSKAEKMLLCDTGPFVLWVWAHYTLRQEYPFASAWMDQKTYDGVILCYPDLPWQHDDMREHPNLEDRDRLYKLYETNILKRYPEALILKGQGKSRTECAIRYINDLSSKKRD